jgi:hypothetical protein
MPLRPLPISSRSHIAFAHNIQSLSEKDAAHLCEPGTVVAPKTDPRQLLHQHTHISELNDVLAWFMVPLIVD